jgi:hypothetical protein
MLAFILVAGLTAFLPAATASASSLGSLPLGLYENGNSAQYPFPVTPKYAIQYYSWYEPFQTADARAAWNGGTETFAELQTCGNPCDSATGLPITSVINGTYDSYLTNFADEVAAFGHPVLLTFDHEMNGSWYPWGDTEITPAQWIEAWQHVTSLISSIAPNAVWVWAPNVEPGIAPVASYWPGNGYPNPHVSIVGLDGYFQNSSSTWANTFSQSVTDAMTVSGGTYPLIIAETGVPSTDPNNVAQIDNLVAGARSAGAAALMYFDYESEWAFTGAEQAELVKDVSASNPATPTGTPATDPPGHPAGGVRPIVRHGGTRANRAVAREDPIPDAPAAVVPAATAPTASAPASAEVAMSVPFANAPTPKWRASAPRWRAPEAPVG